ncbi:MAG: hypothetical protein EXQ88_05755 [Alphaproteobacteria bacterium]|nr:hypothetical protein [Alphaproteobacteria bacterium]
MVANRAHKILAVGATIALVACDQPQDSAGCNALARELEKAAQCIVKFPSDGEALAANCAEDATKFKTTGFTSHDATKIAETGNKPFYKTYYNKDFCTNFFPNWLTRKI